MQIIPTILIYPDYRATEYYTAKYKEHTGQRTHCCTKKEAKCDACNAGLSIKRFCAAISSINSGYNHTGCEG